MARRLKWLRRVTSGAVLLVLLSTLGPIALVNAQAARPNILVIVTDDQRATGTLGMMPATRRWLVRDGTQYPNAFATTPLCCPSRASILTGLLAHNHGVRSQNNQAAAMVAAETLMLQHAMQAGGYRTGLFGKYLNGWPLTRDPSGWDRWTTTPRVAYAGGEWDVDGTIQVVQRNSTPFIGGQTLGFLEQTEAVDDAKPWFAYVGFMAPHLPADLPPQYLDDPVPPFRQTPAMRESDLSDKPTWLRNVRRSADRAVRRIRARQLRSLIPVDDQIGRLMLRLEDLEELDNTLVIFTSDNGYMWDDHGLKGKAAPYDPSIRVPLLVRWPGRAAAMALDGRLATLMDIAPTVLTTAGVPFPHQMDGVHLLGNQLRSRVPLEYWRIPASPVPTWRAVMTRRSIYMEYLDDVGNVRGREYYDLARDPYQLTNVLRDGIRGNEPDLDRLHALTLALSACEGAACLR